MDKLQKYNQKLLAIIGTLALAGAGLLIIAGAITLIADTLRRSGNRKITDNSLTLLNETDTTRMTSQVKQDITFDIPRLIDTLSTLYLIPVSQVNIENRSNDNYEEPLMMSGSRNYSYKKTSFLRYSGEYNNIILYNQAKESKDILFDKKAYITRFSNWIINSRHCLLITGATKDTNGDSKLNDEDMKELFIYDIINKRMIECPLEGHDFIDYYILYNTDKLLLRYAVDKNHNGEINYLQEPVIIKELDSEIWELKDFIIQDDVSRLTEIIN